MKGAVEKEGVGRCRWGCEGGGGSGMEPSWCWGADEAVAPVSVCKEERFTAPGERCPTAAHGFQLRANTYT